MTKTVTAYEIRVCNLPLGWDHVWLTKQAANRELAQLPKRKNYRVAKLEVTDTQIEVYQLD